LETLSFGIGHSSVREFDLYLGKVFPQPVRRSRERSDNMPQNPPIIAGTRIGHVHLKVADLERALGFYCGVLGFDVMQRMGDGAAFISAGGYHHHIGLNTWESKGG